MRIGIESRSNRIGKWAAADAESQNRHLMITIQTLIGQRYVARQLEPDSTRLNLTAWEAHPRVARLVHNMRRTREAVRPVLRVHYVDAYFKFFNVKNNRFRN